MQPTLTPPQPAAAAQPSALQRLVVYGNPAKDGISGVLGALAGWAEPRGIELWVEEGIAAAAERAGLARCEVQAPGAEGQHPLHCMRTFAADAEGAEALNPAVQMLVLCLGGDGTLIHAVHRLWPLTPPVMAVHLGSLSFNATVDAGQVTQAIEAWMEGRAKLTPRMLMQVRLFSGEERVAEYVAVNDVVLAKRSEARLINLTLTQGEERVLEFAGDGIIVSTPTGSTAYNLSAGGPIVFPSLEAMIATAICPHTLAARPVVLPPRPMVTMEYHPHTRREQAMVWVDGQECRPAEPGDRIEMEAAPLPLWLVHLPGAHYFSRLRRKLMWTGHLSPSVADDGEYDSDPTNGLNRDRP